MTEETLLVMLRQRMKRFSSLSLLLSALASSQAYAGLDHEWSLDQSGIWARQYQTGLQDGVIALFQAILVR